MARIRTFIAVDIDPAVRDRAAALQEKLASADSGVKWVEPESMHITLLFLGDVPELDLVPICRSVIAGAQDVAPFTMAINGLGAFPNSRRPKVLWAGITEGADSLRLLHQTIETPLLETGCYRQEERGYNPHLTLGRLNAEDRTDAWAKILTNHADWEGGITQVTEVLVMRSELRRDGPVYSIMGRGKLKGVPVDVDEDEEE